MVPPVDTEIEQSGKTLRVGHAIRELALDSYRLKICSHFLEHEWDIRTGDRNQHNGRGRNRMMNDRPGPSRFTLPRLYCNT